MFGRRSLVALAAALAVLAARPLAQQEGSLDARTLAAAIERALGAAPRGFEALRSPAQAGVRLVSVDVDRVSPASQRVTIDLSQRALTYEPSGDVEVLTDHVLAATAPLTTAARDVRFRFTIDGLPLEQFLARAAAPPLRTRAAGAPGRIVISAGHGLYRHGSGEWRLQRDYYWGIVEDYVNWDITEHLGHELRTAGFDVRMARHPDRAAGGGPSGYGRWQEAAKYFVPEAGAPSGVWDLGVDDYAKDINARPLFANWLDAAAIVSIHNNGGGGTGTETWYDETNGQEGESRRLAEILNSRIVAAIRAQFDPQWPDRGLRACNGCKGENRLASRPAVIVEIAFMDTRTPDNTALQSDAFRRIVAQAIRQGLQEWAGPLPPVPVVPPAASPVDSDGQARRDVATRAARDSRFGAIVEGTFGADLQWEGEWELRWMDVAASGGRHVRFFHLTSTFNRTIRMLGFTDPDTGVWTGWERAGS